jgi:hypothetical protein
MTDPSQPQEQPGATPPPPPPSSQPPGAPRKPPLSAGLSIPGLDVITRDGGAWALAAVVVAVLVTILADLIYAVSSTGSAVATSRFSSGNVTFRVHLLAFTGWATLGVAVALLVGVGLACYVRPSSPAPFRPLIVLAGGTLALAVALFAVIRAIVWLSYGHDYGVAAFVEALATIPVAVVTAALGFGRAAPAA